MPEKLTLLALFAHPDDEAFGTGGTLSKYAHEGVEVHLAIATRGEAGVLANPAISLTQPLGMVREQELRRACACYGVKQLHLLGYIDGQTTIAPQAEAVYKVVELVRQVKPQVMLSFGPDGGYGHYDHLAVHRWATAAVQLAAEADCWPEAGPPHQVAKFYHRAMPQEQLAHMQRMTGRAYVLMGGVPFPFIGHPLERITTVINVHDYVEHKLKGIRCHATQIDPASPYLQETFDLEAFPWFWQETFILAHASQGLFPAVGENGKENDLFAGLR
ncbi:MAG: PIG-L family deacetylase [Anaerolineae bacterium]|nr:PIG-L family deacetylase [Anaerolineae bacterium]